VVLQGFTNVIDEIDSGCYTAVGYGREFSGKTSFGIHMPKPMAIIQNDPKSGEVIADNLIKYGIDPSTVYVSRFLSRVEEISGTHYTARDTKELEDKSNKELQEQIRLYRAALEISKSRIIEAAKHPDIRSVMIDSGTILYEDILHAMYGRVANIVPLMKSKAAAEFMAILQICASQKDRRGRRKHIYITSRLVDEYANDKRTGATHPEGCGKLGYFIKNVLRFRKLANGTDLATVMSTRPDLAGKVKVDDYVLDIERSTVSPHLAGLNGSVAFTNDSINYGIVMAHLYPRVDPSEFFD
jgi:hypothetical protein